MSRKDLELSLPWSNLDPAQERERDSVTVALFPPDLQLPAHLSKPIPAGLVVWQDTTQQPPERRGVVWLPEVDQLVGNDVLDQGRRQGHHPEVEVQPPVPPARPPPEPEVLDLNSRNLDPGVASKAVHPVLQPDVAQPDVPLT